MKRIIVITDLHCGHVAGITPPQWQMSQYEDSTTKRNKWAKLQMELWKEFVNSIDKWKPFDVGFSLGDSIDGKGGKSGATELITADRSEQADMAAEVHNYIRRHSKPEFEWIGVYGTGYHVSAEGGEDWETIVSERANFKKIGSHEWVDVNGVIFDLKHHIGSSSIPHGRHTAAAREKLWNTLWAEKDYQPRSNVILRGHVHYANYCGGPGWIAATLPALQGMGTKFGSRRCSGVVDWGITIFDVMENGNFTMHMDVKKIDTQKVEVIKV